MKHHRNSNNIDNDSFTTTSSLAPEEYEARMQHQQQHHQQQASYYKGSNESGGGGAAFAGFSDGHQNQQTNQSFTGAGNSFAAFRGEAPILPKEINATFVNLSRVTRSEQECTESYNKMSKFYDFMTSSSEREFTDVGLQQLDVQAGERILDLGCGTGYATAKIAQKVGSPSQNPNASVIGVDLSQGMLDQARARLVKEKLLDRTTLLNCNALRLPFANSTFDGILLSFVVELFDNEHIPGLLAEMLRVLKPNGRFTIVALQRKVEKTSVRIYEWFHKKFPSLVDCRPIYIRETLAALNSLVKVTKHSEHSMWTLPVEVVTARKRNDYEVDQIQRQLAEERRRQHNMNNNNQSSAAAGKNRDYYRDLVTDVATEAEKMIMMQRDHQSETNSNSNGNDSFDSTSSRGAGHFSKSGGGIGTRESVLGDTSAVIMSEFGEMKFKAVPRSQWMEDQQTDNCYLCKKEFGIFTRKHHCRICGMLVCAKCSEQKVKLNYGSKEKERICDICFESMGVSDQEM